MKTLISLLALSLSTVALADGFKCEQREHAVNLQVYNKTQATAGTRNVAVMILSDATVAHGRKTIASFTADKSTVRSTGGTSYVAKVDLRVSESNRSGENVLGTKLGQIKEIRVNVAHSYASTSVDGEQFDGSLTVVKRNGTSETMDITCERYLKN